MNYLLEKQMQIAKKLGATDHFKNETSLRESLRPIYRGAKKAIYNIRYGELGVTLPNFLIIGQQKCGTSSLHHYLSLHPDVECPEKKEIHFFDYAYDYGIPFYKSFFSRSGILNETKHVGEATPEYIFHPLAAKRIKDTLPNVKAIVLLRNPVERAFSAWRMGIRQGWEHESFQKAIELEGERIYPDLVKLSKNEYRYGYDWNHFSYLTRGVYIHQINNWLKYFDRKQLLISSSERLFNNPKEEFKRVCEFLELDEWYPQEFRNMFVGVSRDLEHATRGELENFYKPYNQELYELINDDFEW